MAKLMLHESSVLSLWSIGMVAISKMTLLALPTMAVPVSPTISVKDASLVSAEVAVLLTRIEDIRPDSLHQLIKVHLAPSSTAS